MPTPLDVFISYAHADRTLKDELIKHLSNLQSQGLIKTWHDGEIVAGTAWEQQIIEQLNAAHLILLLISKDFMASNFCYTIEMKQAMAKHQANQARVIPILLRKTDWKGTPFSHLQMLPTGAKAVVNWPRRDDAFTDVAEGIRKAIGNLTPDAVTAPGATGIPQLGSGQTPLWNIPYRRNPYFIGQEAVLQSLHTTLKTDKATAWTQPQAISGLGGIGKTQIALEYAYQHRQTYRAILWVQADTRDALLLGFTTLAKLLNLPQKDEQDQAIIVAAVKDWLDTHEQWLFILDNADDLSLLDEFLPSLNSGHILLTTRAQAMGTLANSIDVEPMDTVEGSLLLLRRAKVLPPDALLEQASVADHAAAREIVQELGGLPLALDQAAAYIEETGCGLARYLVRYRAQRTTLLQRRGKRVKEHPEAVATTWSLSFANVEAANPAAADLLRLCACLHPDAIPETLLSVGAPSCIPSLHALADDLIALDTAIETLRAYSLVRRHAETNRLSMHRLVQAVLTDGMNDKQRRQWAEHAVCSVNHLFPEVEFTSWPECERYLLHAQACAKLIATWNLTSSEASHLLNATGSYLYDRAQYAEAEPLYQRALAIREQQLGPDHPDTATSLNYLAALYKTQGKYAEAEPLYQRALVLQW